jgi:hypothetical protein
MNDLDYFYYANEDAEDRHAWWHERSAVPLSLIFEELSDD